MISGKRVYNRRVFAVHGLLLCAVLTSAYLSVRAQYEALRDQQFEEARTDQQLSTRVSGLTLQNQFQLLVSALGDLDRADAPYDIGGNPWLSNAGVIDRGTGRPVAAYQGSPAALAATLKQAAWLGNVARPTVAALSSGQVTVAVPMRDATRVALGIVSTEQVGQDLMTMAQRPTGAGPLIVGARTAIIAEDGRILASAGGDTGGWLQSDLDPPTARKLNELLATGNAGSELLDVHGTTLLAVQPVTVTQGVRWRVVSVRTDVAAAVSLRLKPLFNQLLSQAALMVVAVVVVLISTTVSLTRGRRRIEKLRTEMLNRDLQKARRIQLNWLPAPQYQSAHVCIAAENRPASHISGDFYNWFELPCHEDDRTRKTVVVIGDVSGHGLPAAFLMATTQLLVRNTMPSFRDPGACLAEINRQLCTLVYNGQFVTMMILVIDHDNAGLHIASAGHHAPLLKRDGKVEPLAIDPQLVIGVDDSTEYQTQRFRIRSGDQFLLFTDGAIEMTDESGAQFGCDRLAAAFAAGADAPAEALTALSKTLTDFHGAADAEDDLTLIVAQVDHADLDHAVTPSDVAGHGIG